MGKYQSEYQAWYARERRRQRIRRIMRGVGLCLTGILLAFALYGALVAFLLLMGGE